MYELQSTLRDLMAGPNFCVQLKSDEATLLRRESRRGDEAHVIIALTGIDWAVPS